MSANKYARPDNFGSRIRTPLLREHCVYRAFNDAGELLYVGCTSDLDKRLKAHSSQSREWWDHMVRMTIAGPYNYETAREIERQSIHTERPLFNYTPERRIIAKAHSRVLVRHMHALQAAGMDWKEAFEVAERKANELVPYPGNRHAFRIKDGDTFRAKAADRHHAGQVAA